ncbi:MAG: type II secretion system protein GspL [Pseudomonadota bacterium]
MTQKGICLRLGMSAETPLCWWNADESKEVCGAPQDLASVNSGAHAVVLAPAEALLTLSASLPQMQNQRLRQALPYALEEQFAGDVEHIHFAHGPRREDNTVPVVAVEHALMQQWLALCEEAQIKPQAIYHEALSLPWREGEWTLLLEPDGGLLRTGRESGYALAAEQWSELLTLAWEQRDAGMVHSLRVYDARGDEAAESLPELSGATIEREACEHPLRLLHEGCADNPVDLMQGPYSRREKMSRLWAPWRTTAVLLGIWVGVHLITAVYDFVKLSTQDETLYQQTEQLFRTTFPEVKNVTNPRVQMERRLAALREGGTVNTFTTLLGGVGNALTDNSGVSLQRLRYRQGSLELELELESLPILDRFKAALERQNVTVEVRNASARGEKVEASIVVSEASA